MARAPSESLHGAELLFAVLEGVRRQLQTGDPTFRPLFQGSDPLRGEVQAHRTSEEIRRLLVGEAQVGGADLGQPFPGAQPRERQRRTRASGDDQVHRRRPVVKQKGEGVVDGLRA